MTVSTAKEKICQFMSSNCICSDCMAWEYTATHTSEIANKKDFTEQELKWYEENRFKFYNDANSIALLFGKKVFYEELEENEKIGYCKRLSCQ